MIAYSYYPSAPGGCRAMPVARCCAAIPKQRDSLMLSCTPGCPFRGVSLCCHTRLALPMQRDVLMLSYKPGFPFREMSLCCHTSWVSPFRETSSYCHASRAFHSERCPHAVMQARLPIQRDVLMLSCKQGCNPDFPCIAARGDMT